MDHTPERLSVDDFESKPSEDGTARVPNNKGIVERWFAELELADTTEDAWRKEARDIRGKYRSEKERASQTDETEAAFNMLWSNTEILVPALYNSTPTPDVRRRFKEADPVGKQTSTVLERAISCEMDSQEDFDDEVVAAVLDLVLIGRGVSRIRYRPRVASVPLKDGQTGEQGRPAEPTQRVIDQATEVEHVQWDKFRRGPGKRWRDVPWVSFELDLSYDDLIEYFGQEVADKVPMTGISDDQAKGMDPKSGVRKLFQSAVVFEIWDKIKRRVLFITKGVDEPLLIDENPTLKLRRFFPMPRPAMAILESSSLLPIPLYRQYKSQAEEIDRITQRIEKITYALRVRGAYLSAVKEAKEILDAGDLVMVPIEDAATAISQIGLDKAIWIMPIDMLVQVLEGLYKARNEIKQTIYEIIGLSDIMRGATQASETLGAQELKSRWGSVRLQRMQKEVQRFVRDLLRLIGEVIADQYEPQVLAQMTQVALPTRQEQQAVKEQIQKVTAAAQQAQAQVPPGSPPPPPPQIPPEVQQVVSMPSWDDVMAVLRSDSMRQYRINIETDSTITEILNRDFQGMSEILQALGQVFGAIPLLMQSGASNGSEVVKEIALAVVRQSRMGRSVEDAVDNLDFKGGNMQMQQLGDMVKQIGAAVQQGSQQVAQLHEHAAQTDQKLGQTQQVLGQIVKTLGAMPKPPSGSPMSPSGMHPAPPAGPQAGAPSPMAAAT